MLLALFLACAIPYPQACEQYAQEYCDVCELTKEEKARCTCLDEGSITKDAIPDRDWTDDDAQLQCDVWINAVKYPSPSESSYCKQALSLLKAHKAELCATVTDSGGAI